MSYDDPMMFYDEPKGCDGDMRQYDGLDPSAFQPPTDEEYREAYKRVLDKEAEQDGGAE